MRSDHPVAIGNTLGFSKQKSKLDMNASKAIIVSLIGVVASIGAARAQIYDTNNEMVQTFAGYGLPYYADGQGQFSAFWLPSQIVADTASNLYVWDSGNSRLREITPSATVTTLAGGGTQFEGYGTNVSLSWATGGALAMDHVNKLWLVMAGGYYGGTYLLSITTNGYVALENGGLTNLGSASGLCFDSANRLYYTGGNRIFRYDPVSKLVEPFAGNGLAGNFDGQGTVFTAFSSPGALACDQADNLYVWDSGNGTIRRIDQNQNVTTIAGNGYTYYNTDGTGTNAAFGYNSVASMFADGTGNIYFVGNGCIRRMDAQTNIVTLAGAFYSQTGYVNGPGNVARFDNPVGGCYDQGTIYIADAGNNRIRDLTFNAAAQAATPAGLQIQTYAGVQITGTIGRTYQVQSSPDMTNWTTVATLLLTSSPYLWVDTNPVAGTKFYRAVLVP